MGLKQFIDEHPLKILAGVAVAVATTTSGVTGYFLSESDKIERLRLEVETKSEIATLKTRLASIERRVGTDDRSYFDISKLIVVPEQIKELDANYKTMAGGTFFIAEPSQGRWRYSHTSEYEVLKEGIEFSDSTILAAYERALSKKNVNLWKSDEAFIVHPAMKKGKERITIKRLVFYPSVAVQVFTEQDLQDASGLLEGSFAGHPKPGDIVKALETVVQAVPGSQKNEIAAKQTAAEVTTATESKLSELFRGDVAASLLSALIRSNQQLTTSLSNVRYSLRTAQKRGNVLFMEARLEFADVMVEGRALPGRLIVDTEYFVVTSPAGVVVVKIVVPSFDGRADAYAWASQWLTGLRVPIVR